MAFGRAGMGFTIAELIVAMAVALAFLSGVYMTFIQVIKAHNLAQARTAASINARTAIATLSDEIKSIDTLAGNFLMIGIDAALTYGDGIDNDLDGSIDEEKVDGLNNDGDGSPGDDQHAVLGSLRERPLYASREDLGDRNVDEDCVFGRDVLIFRSYPAIPTPDMLFKSVSYAVTDYDGQSNVLVRQTRIERVVGEPLVGVAPIAFGVLGFDLLYWDPNAAPASQYWVQTWDSSQSSTFAPPRLPLPAAVYIRLTMAADPRPGEAIAPGSPIQTLIMSTVVDVEETIGDVLYPRPVL